MSLTKRQKRIEELRRFVAQAQREGITSKIRGFARKIRNIPTAIQEISTLKQLEAEAAVRVALGRVPGEIRKSLRGVKQDFIKEFKGTKNPRDAARTFAFVKAIAKNPELSRIEKERRIKKALK